MVPTSGPTKAPEFVPALGFRFLTPLYDLGMRLVMREGLFRTLLIECLQLAAGMSVLDLGCGTGTLAIQIKRVQPLVDVVGLDPDPDVLRIAMNKARGAGVHVDFTRGSAESLPFESGNFDVIVSSLTFHHLTPALKAMALREAIRVLKPRGRLTIADFGPPRTRIGLAATLPIRLMDGRTTTDDNFLGRLPSIIEKAGFRNVREVQRIRTVVGPVCYYVASPPEEVRGPASELR